MLDYTSKQANAHGSDGAVDSVTKTVTKKGVKKIARIELCSKKTILKQ